MKTWISCNCDAGYFLKIFVELCYFVGPCVAYTMRHMRIICDGSYYVSYCGTISDVKCS